MYNKSTAPIFSLPSFPNPENNKGSPIDLCACMTGTQHFWVLRAELNSQSWRQESQWILDICLLYPEEHYCQTLKKMHQVYTELFSNENEVDKKE